MPSTEMTSSPRSTPPGAPQRPVELTSENLAAYLRQVGALADRDAAITELGWGISNAVFKVESASGCIVVKQSLPRLRVEAEWLFDRSRILGERDCMHWLGRLLPAGSVPSVVFSDEPSFVLGMTCAPPGGVLWKQALLEGRVDLPAARRAGALLAQIHTSARSVSALRARFADQTVMVQGRVEPYHLTAAAAHPELAGIIHDEVERLLATRVTLVLGDYCPKNTFVYPDRVLIIDFEVAHWGDPAFDVAFCVNHFILKACRFPDRAERYLAAAQAFWQSYGVLANGLAAGADRAAARELGVLLLARIDGKSKIEYITDDATRDFVRALAAELLRNPTLSLGGALRYAGRRIAERQGGRA